MSQPHCWSECLQRLSNDSNVNLASDLAIPGAEWLFIGCGSSFYLATAAAATFNHLALPARAIPASEILLYPELVIPRGHPSIPVMISRSGMTSEVLSAVRFLKEKRSIPAIAITCAAQQSIEALVDVTLKLLPADEKSTVMTRSFTSMLLGLQYLGATAAGNAGFRDDLMKLPEQVAPLLETVPALIKEFVERREFDDYVFLAQGPLFGIASEAMLKVTESSCSYAQVFHAMEFRHGPKSIVDSETLVAFFVSESSYDAEIAVLEDMKQLGATTIVIANRLDQRARKAADLAIELKLGVSEYARLAAYAVWGQLYGAFTGISKGLNPDSPRNLSRVVTLEGQQ